MQYDASVTGTVTNTRSKGLEHPTMITVEYEVNGRIYSITESIKLKSTTIKLGFYRSGRKRHL